MKDYGITDITLVRAEGIIPLKGWPFILDTDIIKPFTKTPTFKLLNYGICMLKVGESIPATFGIFEVNETKEEFIGVIIPEKQVSFLDPVMPFWAHGSGMQFDKEIDPDWVSKMTEELEGKLK